MLKCSLSREVPGGSYASVDITTPAACNQAVAECIDAFGRLDVLVNVAGFHQMRHTPTMSDDDWERDLAVNLNGPFYLCRAALPHLLGAGGNIVNVASIAGVEGEVYSAGYCAAKHGLVGLTRALAVEFTKDKLRVNVVCPGGVATSMNDDEPVGGSSSSAPLARRAIPSEISPLIAYLLTDASSFVTGSVIPIAGGLTAV